MTQKSVIFISFNSRTRIKKSVFCLTMNELMMMRKKFSFRKEEERFCGLFYIKICLIIKPSAIITLIRGRIEQILMQSLVINGTVFWKKAAHKKSKMMGEEFGKLSLKMKDIFSLSYLINNKKSLFS